MQQGTGRVAGKTAIVTGGSGDLGSATVRLLAEEGALVASLDRPGAPAAGLSAYLSRETAATPIELLGAPYLRAGAAHPAQRVQA